jgi:hypothetical protein
MSVPAMSSKVGQHNHIRPEDSNTQLQKGQYETSVPTARDRIVQAAGKIVLEPVFEADFLPCSFGLCFPKIYNSGGSTR